MKNSPLCQENFGGSIVLLDSILMPLLKMINVLNVLIPRIEFSSFVDVLRTLDSTTHVTWCRRMVKVGFLFSLPHNASMFMNLLSLKEEAFSRKNQLHQLANGNMEYCDEDINVY